MFSSGRDSEDIDIAIDNMTGREFLENNLKQSKHLETGKMRLCNQWLDFVQLRKEEADENSRVPKSDFGTPEEDVYRRDLTINSLFYNIHTGLVEDHTGRGIDDIKSGRLITPLPAKLLFWRIPCEFLRLIALYGFTMDEELKEAASSEEVRVALERKISVTYLSDFKLFGVVSAIPSSSEPAPRTNCDSLCLAYMEAMGNLIQTPGLVSFSGEQRRLALYAALLLPFRKSFYKDNEGKLVSVVNYILKNFTKRKFKDAETVSFRFLSLILPLQRKSSLQLEKLDWASEILEICESISLNDPEPRDIKDFWRVSLLISLLLYKDDDGMNHDLDKKREIYLTIQDTIHELDLDNVWDEKPLMKGDEIIEEVQKGGPVTAKQDLGPIIREWQKKMLTWKLTYDKGSQRNNASIG
ncbi:hypothetical protein Bca52824_079273 [Brassica carinata]|uniref:Poly A polymerase head domain-containing protein n=1 Tax=Brassica carinata TaxID=52824 RepID=A0A8X7TZY4_BRACI|nr:hypothetical protein Bca52824_079273 [Brassica carinata]